MALTGRVNHCPVCQAALWASEVVGQKQCPRCGAELWVLRFSAGPAFFLRRSGQSLGDFLMPLLGEEAEAFAGSAGADSLDWVELVMEVEGRLAAYDPAAQRDAGVSGGN